MVVTMGMDHEGNEHRGFTGVGFHFTVLNMGFSGSNDQSEKV